MARVSLLMAIGLALAMFPAAITDAKRAAPRAKHAAKEPIVHAQRWAHMRSVAKETGIVELHELQGRPLYARSGTKSQRFKPAGMAPQSALRAAGKEARKRLPALQYLVRVVHPMPAGLTKYLEELAAGGFFVYLPLDTFVLTMGETALEKARRASGVIEVYEYPASMKMAPELSDIVSPGGLTSRDKFLNLTGAGRRSVPDGHESEGLQKRSRRKASGSQTFVLEVIVAFAGSGWSAMVQGLTAEWTEAFSNLGVDSDVKLVSKQKVLVKVHDVHALKQATAWLVRQPLVHWVQERHEVFLLNTWATMAIQSPTVTSYDIWDRGIHGTNQIVGVADTGLDYDNCFFSDSTIGAPMKCSGSGYVSNCFDHSHRKIVTYRKFAESDYLDEAYGHGTHVAGSVAGSKNQPNPDSPNQYNGAAPGAKIAFDDIGDSDGELTGIPDDLATGLFPHSYAAGARIHSNSWGSSYAGYNTMSMEIDQFAASHDDFLVLVAAGNDGENGPFTVGSPATAKNILAVGATENADAVGSTKHHTVASFSSMGPTYELRMKPDVLCPGHAVSSAYSDGDPSSNNCNVVGMSGTSMATPLCAGSAALVRDYFEQGYAAGGVPNAATSFSPSAALVKAVMIHSAQPASPGQGVDMSYPNPETGYGRVELSSALYFADSIDPLYKTMYKDRQAVAEGESIVFCVHVDAGSEFRVSIVWTDPPGTPASSHPLIHDLDLVVIDGSNVYLGNSLKQTDETSGPYAYRDSINNAEQIRVAQPTAGLYAIRVLGTDVPTSFQNFSLVASAKNLLEAAPAQCSELKCPADCSGRGQCLASGICECPITHGGADCSRAHNNLFPVTDSTQTTMLSVTWMGMSYYVFTVPAGEIFNISFWPSPQSADYADADFYIARERLPTVEDHDAAIADQWSEGYFYSLEGNSEAVTWVIGLQAFAGDAQIETALVFGGDGSPTPPSNCSAPCNCDRFTGEQGSFSDGSGSTDYGEGKSCWWMVAPETSDLQNISLTFTEFDTEDGWDFVRVWFCTDPWCGNVIDTTPPQEELSGLLMTPYTVSASGTPALLITFTSDHIVHSAGFQATWAVNAAPAPSPPPSPPAPAPSPPPSPPAPAPSPPDDPDCTLHACECGYYTSLNGALTDGSTSGNYPHDTKCRWIIDLTVQNAAVQLEFSKFATEHGYDFVTINQCQSVEWQSQSTIPECMFPLRIAKISGDFPGDNDVGPGYATYFALTGIMEVIFTSDYSTSGDGFDAVWQPANDMPPGHVCTLPCNCQVFTSSSGTFEDGSMDKDYSNGRNCSWEIAPTGATWVKLRFTQFDLEERGESGDFVRIYECPSGDCSVHSNLVAHVTSNDLDLDEGYRFVAQGTMLIRFESDAEVVGKGFTAEWISSESASSCETGEWPERPTDAWQRCSLPTDWKHLKPDGYVGNLRVGGLGTKITPDENFHTWVCHYSHACARRLNSSISSLHSGSGSPTGSGSGDNAVTAKECYLGCNEAGYGCGFGVGKLDYYYGCCGALSCMQTCMMRVSGVSYESCVDKVYEVSNAEANRCSVVVDGREYDSCGAYDQSKCEVEPTVASGLTGCVIGDKPDISQMDPFCWVYNEGCKQFEPYGHGSRTKLI